MKKAIIFIVIAALVLTITPALIFAGGKWVDSQKAPFYKVYGGSSNVVSDDLAGGQVTLVDPMGNVSMVIQGNVRGLDPLAMYDVWVRDLTGYTGTYITKYEPLGYFKLATITTDAEGNGSFHFNLRTDELPDGEYNIQVALNPYNNQGITVIATQWPGMSVTVKTQ
jgi:hypothetical protein